MKIRMMSLLVTVLSPLFGPVLEYSKHSTNICGIFHSVEVMSKELIIRNFLEAVECLGT